MSDDLRPSRWRNVLKIAGAICVSIAIGFGLVSLSEDGEVAEGQADIYAGQFAPPSGTEAFHDALRSLGHPEPTALDLNGNRIFFSVNKVELPPKVVSLRYQKEFVARGINERVYPDDGASLVMQRRREGFSGGVVPMEVTPRRVVFSGVDNRDGITSPWQLARDFDREKPLEEQFSAYRWLEMYRPAGASETTVIASWSDEEFDYAKMQPKTGRQAREAVDERVPICPGCTLVNSLSDAATPGEHLSYVFTSKQSVQQLEQYYTRVFQQRGWSKSDTGKSLEQLRRKLPGTVPDGSQIQLERGEWQVDVVVTPDDVRRSSVRVVLVDQEYLDRFESE